MIDLIHRFVLPAAYALLPPEMQRDEATAFLLAIGNQESDQFSTRHQYGRGPACGFWQFETGGVRAVLTHPRTSLVMRTVLRDLRYDPSLTVAELQPILADNDVLAACFARCLLWAARSTPLPLAAESDLAWVIYLDTWRPGRPRRETWRRNYAAAWDRMTPRGDDKHLEA